MSGQRAVHELRAGAPEPLGAARTAGVAAGICACVFAAGLAVVGVRTRVGSPPCVHGLSAAPAYLATAELALALVVLVGLVFLFRPTRRPPADDELEAPREHPPAPFWHKLVALLVILAAILSPILAVWLLGHHHPKLRAGSDVLGNGPHGAARLKHVAPSSGLQVHWTVFAVVAGLALAGLLVLAVARGRGAPPADEEPDADALAFGGGDPEFEPDPRRAVLKAYAGMERALGEDGLPRRPTEAPLEYLGRVRAGRRAAGRLTALFERARFSRHEIDEPMRRDALDALDEVRSELEQDR